VTSGQGAASQLASRSPDQTAAVALPRRGASQLAWTLLGLIVALMAASLAVAFTGGETWNAKLAVIPVEFALAVVGALVAARTMNRLGWLFLAASTAGAAAVFAGAYAARVPSAELPGAPWLGWIFPMLVGLGDAALYLLALLFPDGRLPSRRWRPVVWVAITAGVVAPLGAPYSLCQLAGTAVLLAGAVCVIVRYRRAGHDERLQLKWFVYAAAVSAVAISVSSTFMSNPLSVFDIFFPLIPAAVGIAILKYRLYDIDRLISRTLAYAIVTGLLVGVYAGLVLLATEVFRFHTPVAVAAATLAAAALFNPVRRRVQRIVDRRFNRVRYDADLTVAAFAGTLRDAVDPDTVRADLLAAVIKSVEPAHISLWTGSSST
jgi:MFS family permease